MKTLHCGGRDCSPDNPARTVECNCCHYRFCITCDEPCPCALGTCDNPDCMASADWKDD